MAIPVRVLERSGGCDPLRAWKDSTLTATRGDTKPCPIADCPGTMQFGRRSDNYAEIGVSRHPMDLPVMDQKGWGVQRRSEPFPAGGVRADAKRHSMDEKRATWPRHQNPSCTATRQAALADTQRSGRNVALFTCLTFSYLARSSSSWRFCVRLLVERAARPVGSFRRWPPRPDIQPFAKHGQSKGGCVGRTNEGDRVLRVSPAGHDPVGGWAVLVPEWMSRATFGAIAAVGFGLAVISLMTLNAGRSTPSVAHVLYVTETEPRGPVKAAARELSGAAGGGCPRSSGSRALRARVLLAVCAIAQSGAPRSDKLEFLS
jgi:hypothetical protein